jgi:hypothetical protein
MGGDRQKQGALQQQATIRHGGLLAG